MKKLSLLVCSFFVMALARANDFSVEDHESNQDLVTVALFWIVGIVMFILLVSGLFRSRH